MQVGDCIYRYVEQMAGDEKAPKVTGMLIDLPIEEIRDYLTEHGKLKNQVEEAINLLNRSG